MRRWIPPFLAGAVLFLGTLQPARALTITFPTVYEEVITAVGVGSGVNVSAPFETGILFPSALGELESVDLVFSGTIVFQISSGLSTTVIGGNVVPQPYRILPQLEISVLALPNLYSFDGLRLSTSYDATGLGETVSLTGTYSFRFSYIDSAFSSRPAFHRRRPP